MTTAQNAVEQFRFRDPSEYKPGDILISHEQIQRRLTQVAKDIAHDYQGQSLLLVGLLHGARPVAKDLARQLRKQGLRDLKINYLKVNSYRGTHRVKEPVIEENNIAAKDKNVLIVDDIADTRWTLYAVSNYFALQYPTTIKSFALLDKSEKQEAPYRLDYSGFVIPSVWVQGYGMDTDGYGRRSKDIIIGPVRPFWSRLRKR